MKGMIGWERAYVLYTAVLKIDVTLMGGKITR